MGIGTFFTGPISDAIGRKPVIYGGAVLYIAASAVAWASSSLELVLAARVAQGLGRRRPARGRHGDHPRSYSGREMARIISIAMMIFTLVPPSRPMLGAGVIACSAGAGYFVSFILFASVIVLWMGFRAARVSGAAKTAAPSACR